nr:hypothetical protein Iba_scaffold5942CG0350 [Ipomoea batatas]
MEGSQQCFRLAIVVVVASFFSMDGWSGAVDGHRFFFSNPVVAFPIGVADCVFLADGGAGHAAGGFLVAVVGFNNGGLRWWPSAIVAVRLVENLELAFS